MSRPHYLWIDNFSKFLRKSVPTASSGVYATCNWTGAAVFETNDDSLDDHVRRYFNDTIIAAMPDNILECNADVRAKLKEIMLEGRNYYDVSYVKHDGVNNVPPKINTRTWPNLKDRIECKENSMNAIYPQKLIDINIGSNAGLCTIMRQLYDQYNMHDTTVCERYLNLNVDENIYWRVMKVSICIYVHTHIHTFTLISLHM